MYCYSTKPNELFFKKNILLFCGKEYFPTRGMIRDRCMKCQTITSLETKENIGSSRKFLTPDDAQRCLLARKP